MTLEGSNILVTGGTGSFGRAFVSALKNKSSASCCLSRGEMKQ